MAVKIPLVLAADGSIEQLQSGDTLSTAGAGSDLTLVAATGGLSALDVVYITNAGEAAKARANAVGTANAIGFAFGAASGGANAQVRTDGVLTGFTSLTPGQPVFLSAATAGAIVQTPPTTAGEFVVRLGVAINATTVEIEIEPRIKL